MSDLVYPYKPTIVIGKVNRAFSDCGLNSTNIVKIIKISTTGFQSFNPEDVVSAIMGFEVGGAYLVQSKSLIDLTGLAYNTTPDDFTIVPGINVYANTWFAGIAIDTADFTTVGFDTTNLDIIYCIDDPYMSFNPNDGANAITGFVTGQAYLGYALADMDISSYLIPPVVITSDFEQDVEPFKYWGTKDTTTKGYWNVTTRFVDAEIDRQEIVGILWIAESEKTASFWDGAAYQKIGGGTSYTDEQAQDAVGTILSSEFTYDDTTPLISVNQIAYSKITGTPTIPTQYTDEMAQDATAALFAAGTHTGITFTYDDASNKIDAVVTGASTPGIDSVLAVGQALTTNRTIAAGTNQLSLTGSSSSAVIQATSTSGAGASAAIAAISGAGSAFSGSASTGTGGTFTSQSGIAVAAQSTSSLAIRGIVNPSSTNTDIDVLELRRTTTGTAASGIGARILFALEMDNGSNSASNYIVSKWTNATATAQISELVFRGVNAAVTVDVLALGGQGYMKLNGITATAASAITPTDGMMVYVTSTNGTFTSVGLWSRENSTWVKL